MDVGEPGGFDTCTHSVHGVDAFASAGVDFGHFGAPASEVGVGW